MFSPFAFIQPENLANIIAGATTSSLFVVGDFYTYKATDLGNIAILTDSGSRRFRNTGISLFNQGGDDLWGSTRGGGANNVLNQQHRIAVTSCNFEPNGKLMIAGKFQNYSGSSANYLRRLNADGSRDLSWTVGSLNAAPITALRQRDSKYVISGTFTSYSGSAVNRLVRTNISGTIDTTFKPGTSTNNYAYSILEDASNRLVLGGNFTTYSGSTVNYIVRINTNATIDTSFNMGTGFNGTTRAIVMQSDGKLIVSGDFSSYSGSSTNRIVRINTNGTLDTTYKAGSTLNQFSNATTPYGLGIQTDNKVIAHGEFTQYSGSVRNRLTRINTDGTLDTTFNPGSGFDQFDNDTTAIDIAGEQRIIIDSAGKIYVAGGFTSYSGSAVNALIKLNPDGTIDTTFDYTGSFVSGFGYNRYDTSTSQIRGPGVAAIALTGSTLAAAGRFITYKESHIGGIARLDLSGSMYQRTALHTFGGFQYTSYNSSADTQANVIKKIGDKFIVAGGFTQYNSTSSIGGIIMLNSDFSRDTTFKSGVGFNSAVSNLHYIPATNKILVTGTFTTYSGSSVNRIARLNLDGTLDTSFATGLSGFNNDVWACVTESNGKIICSGTFTTYNAATQNRIIRLNENGTVDTDFKTGNGVATVGATVSGLALQSDGKIIFGGPTCTAYSGSVATTRGSFRAMPSGSEDTTFKGTWSFSLGPVFIKQAPDGKLVMLSEATTYSGSSVNGIVRTNLDGTVDTSFKQGTGFNAGGNYASSNRIEFDPDGNIYIAGWFSNYSGSRIQSLVKLKANGSIDPIFVLSGSNGNGFNNKVKGILLDISTI
jgi:uncharacterized delta-60 repeat protein